MRFLRSRAGDAQSRVRAATSATASRISWICSGFTRTRSTPWARRSSADSSTPKPVTRNDRHLRRDLLHGAGHLPARHARHGEVGDHQVEGLGARSARSPRRRRRARPRSGRPTRGCRRSPRAPAARRRRPGSAASARPALDARSAASAAPAARRPRAEATGGRSSPGPARSRRRCDAAVARDDAVGHRQAEAGALRALGREERIEDLVADLGRHAHAAVGHRRSRCARPPARWSGVSVPPVGHRVHARSG